METNKIYVLCERGQFSGEINRFDNRKDALRAMLKYNLAQETYNQWAKKVKKYSFPLARVQKLYGFNSK
jgi:crotonobetainyl-CoA:carnitine CoA-transferase CaiB-like acyl-CoA transferase